MGFRSYDFKCTNEECSAVGETEERLIKYSSLCDGDLETKIEQQVCEHCGESVQRLIGAPMTHISWSLWRANLG